MPHLRKRCATCAGVGKAQGQPNPAASAPIPAPAIPNVFSFIFSLSSFLGVPLGPSPHTLACTSKLSVPRHANCVGTVMATIALHSAASGLSALNTSMDVIANNLANVNTPGFKASRANFQDLLYANRAQPGVENANGDQRPIGLQVGLGVRVSGTQLSFSQGALINTTRPLDVAIEGNGFFKVSVQPTLGNGTAYTRAGSFAVNSQGQLVMANDQGRRLDPPVTIPDNATAVTIDATGRVLAQIPGNVEPQEVGQIELATFINPAGLSAVGENLFVETGASGNAISGNPASDQRGQLKQGVLENSNVDPTEELINLIKTQRAFEMNSQTIRAADENLKTVANLRR